MIPHNNTYEARVSGRPIASEDEPILKAGVSPLLEGNLNGTNGVFSDARLGSFVKR